MGEHLWRVRAWRSGSRPPGSLRIRARRAPLRRRLARRGLHRRGPRVRGRGRRYRGVGAEGDDRRHPRRPRLRDVRRRHTRSRRRLQHEALPRQRINMVARGQAVTSSHPTLSILVNHAPGKPGRAEALVQMSASMSGAYPMYAARVHDEDYGDRPWQEGGKLAWMLEQWRWSATQET